MQRCCNKNNLYVCNIVALKRIMKYNFMSLHIDFLGFSTSLLCAIHCAALPFLISISPLLGQYLHNHAIENAIIILSFFIASYALVRGYCKHHNPQASVTVSIGFIFIVTGHLVRFQLMEITLTSLGATAVAIAHFINWNHIRKSRLNHSGCMHYAKSVEKND